MRRVYKIDTKQQDLAQKWGCKRALKRAHHGAAKTFLYNAIYAKVRLLGMIVLPTVALGIVASNMPTGCTAHSRFKIPNDCGQYMSCNVRKQLSLAALIKEVALII